MRQVEVVVGGGHSVRPVQHHNGAAVGAHHQAGILVEFLHLSRTSPVLLHPLNDVPGLPVDDGPVAAFYEVNYTIKSKRLSK